MRNHETLTTKPVIPTVLAVTSCPKHNAFMGIPCFHMRKGAGNGYYAGICNDRALRAGCNGEVDPRSIHAPTRQANRPAKKR